MTQNDLSFSAKVESKDISVWNINKYFGLPDVEFDTYGGKYADVNFDVEIEARSWGIKDIYVIVMKVVATIPWSVYAEDVSEEEKVTLLAKGGTEYRNGNIEGEIEIDSSKDDTWTIESELSIDGGMVCVGNIEIDFENKTITVQNN